MNHSESIGNLATALRRAQSEMPKAKFNMTNPYYKSRYADLGSVIEASEPSLSKYGLSIVQFPASDFDGRVGVTSVLMHDSGEWLEETILVPLGDTNKPAEKAGIAITYLRRYARAAITQVVAEEDTDGLMDEAEKKVKEVMARNWTPEQTEAISVTALDEGLEPVTAEDASSILDKSILPGDAPVKTIKSWFRHFIKAQGDDVQKTMEANTAYTNAKNKTGGK